LITPDSFTLKVGDQPNIFTSEIDVGCSSSSVLYTILNSAISFSIVIDFAETETIVLLLLLLLLLLFVLSLSRSEEEVKEDGDEKEFRETSQSGTVASSLMKSKTATLPFSKAAKTSLPLLKMQFTLFSRSNLTESEERAVELELLCLLLLESF